MKKTKRTMQVGDVVREALSTILVRDISDPDLVMVSVTEVEMTTDLKEARVHVSVIGDSDKQERAMDALERHRGRIRKELGARARLRYTPALRFMLDTTAERAMKIESILREVLPVDDETGEDDDSDR